MEVVIAAVGIVVTVLQVFTLFIASGLERRLTFLEQHLMGEKS